MKLILVICAAGLTAAAAPGAQLDPTVRSWLASQTNIQSWSAGFTQTRTLKSLVQPLTAQGRVWFAAPNRFRWELGQPAQTIAVRAPDELLVIYPRLKRVERFPLTRVQAGAWRDALGLLEAGFPRSAAELEAQYHVLAVNPEGRTCGLVLEPKSAETRRMIPRIKIVFDTVDSSLLGTELEFADGSSMRNDFKTPVLNLPVEPQLFNPQIPKDYTVTEPLKTR